MAPTIESDTFCVIQKMTHFLCWLMSTDQRSICGVGCRNATDTKDHLLWVKQAIFGVGQLKLADTKDGYMM
jgi:hypothetical protein